MLTLALVALTGCATRPPAGVRGHWTAVNHYSDTPQPIALNASHSFYATPLDRTLKGLLERWARDAHLTLDYANAYDYTLHRPVADLHSDDLHSALVQLAGLYAAEHVQMDMEGDRIIVRPAQAAASTRAAAPTDAAPAK